MDSTHVDIAAESERWRRLYETVLSNTPDLIYVFDLKHRFIYANKALLDIWGRTWEEAIGKTCLELGYEPWHAAMHDREIEQVIVTKQSIRGEVPFTGVAGTHIYDYIFAPILDTEGKVEGIAGTTRDITDRKQAEENNARLAAIVESSDDAIISKDLNGIITSWNPSAERLFGYTAQEAVGMPVMTLIPPERFDEEPGIINAIRCGKSIEHYETIRCRKDGSQLNISLTVSPIRNARDEIVGASKIARDITESKRADKELRESEQRFRMLFDSMDEGYCVIEVLFDDQKKRAIDYRFLDINPAFEKQTGLKNAKGKLMRQLVPRHEQHWYDIYGEIALTGETRRFENRAAALNRWYEVCAFRVGSAEMHHVGIIFNDITEQKRITEERQAMLESERAARSEAERAGRMKDEFLATLSHELRTPLNAILGYATIMRMAKLDEAKSREAIETIERNARIQAQLIQDLLDMNGIISGKVRLEMQRINIGEVIEEAVKTVRPSAEVKNIKLHVLLDSPAVPVRADPNRIQQVVWNLLSNAIKFTPRGGKVQVWLNPVNSYVALTVSDTGSGISSEFLPYVFDRFRQADGSITRPHGGLGLGLAIAKQLVELHGGSIRAESAGENQGATFIVHLPVLAVISSENKKEVFPVPYPEHVIQQRLEGEDERVDLIGVRVLVVDDEPDATRLVKLVLQDCRAVVLEATSAQQALDLLSQSHFDVLVSDVGMPGEDGYQLIRKVRTMSHANRNIAAIALTAFARSEDRRRAALAGFQTHLVKPIEAPELIANVANLAGRTIAENGKRPE